MRLKATSNSHLFAVSPWLIVTTLGGSLALAAYLVPQQQELAQRFMADGQHVRAIETVINEPVEVRKAVEELPAELPTEEPARQLSPLEQLRLGLEHREVLGQNADLGALIAQANAPEACLDLVRQMSEGLTLAEREKVYLAMARSALGVQNPGFAVEILLEAKRRGVATPEWLELTVQSCRWTQRSAEAAELIAEWKKSHPLPERVADAEISLLREANRPGQALDLLLEKLAQQRQSGLWDKDTILLAAEVAGHAQQAQRTLPLLVEFLNRFVAGRASFADFAAGTVQPSAEWLALAYKVAQHAEWSNNPTLAYDLYMKLAVQGNPEALARLLELDPGLNREGDLLEVLKVIVPVKGKPELQLMLARLAGGAGEYALAEKTYGDWLKAHPTDTVAWKELGALFEETSEYPKALEAFRRAAEINPNDVEARKSVADLQITQRQYREAFLFYQQLEEKHHDATTIENYALLAESLADYHALNRALVLRHHRLKKPTSQDYLELAKSYKVIGDEEGVIATYQEGLRKLRKSRILRLELANAYREQERYDDALALLADPALKTDMQAMQLFIEVACLKEDYQYALAFLGRGFENQFAFGPEVRLDLGHIYFNNGYLREAEALYNSVPDEPALWPLLASARFKRGDYRSAEIYQRKYLASLEVPDATGWMFMGDIYKIQGREQEAKAAYTKSLELMEEKLEPDSGPPPDKPLKASLN